MSLTKRDKERQLNELTLIVTGIRLFNRECDKGGEGIDDCKFTCVTYRHSGDVLLFAMSDKLSFQNSIGFKLILINQYRENFFKRSINNFLETFLEYHKSLTNLSC